MNFKINDIEDAARTTLLDTDDSAYRYTPREIFIAIRDGMKTLRGIRPESRYVNGELSDKLLYTMSGTIKTECEFEIPASAGEYEAFREKYVNMEDRWQETLVYYVIYRMYLKDDPDTVNNQLAANYYQMFERSALS